MERVWTPRCDRPTDLVRPVRVDRTGQGGPTPGQVRGLRWSTCAPGLFVPRDRPDHVEQRIVEQAARLNAGGAVAAWAALRWHGAAYFDGWDAGGVDRLPVPLLLGLGGSRLHSASHVSKTQLAPAEREVVDGVAVTTVARALFDEVVRRRPDLWESVTAVAMTYAAGLLTPAQFAVYVDHRHAWEGVPHARDVVAVARPGARSPREVWLDLVWRLVARLPPARLNRPVFALDGTFLAVPDLLDTQAGLVAEYDGHHHLRHAQRKADLDRERLLRAHGLEYVTVVRGDSRAEAAARLLEARDRAAFLRPSQRAWTLREPEWWQRRHGVRCDDRSA